MGLIEYQKGPYLGIKKAPFAKRTHIFHFFGHMSRDKRYGLIHVNYKKGNIKTFKDIFEYVPKSVIARDLGTRIRRFNRMIDKMEGITFKDLTMMAIFCEIDEAIMFALAEKEYFMSKTKFESINQDISN